MPAMADPNFARLLNEFTSLAAEDRRAVEAMLSPAERRQLKNFFDRDLPQQRAKTTSSEKTTPANLGVYSRWLGRRLARIVGAPANASDLTPHAHALVLKTLALNESSGARRS
jgi:hypothetical protein